MPTRPTLPPLPELSDVPAPVLALVGAGDAAVELARELPAKIASVDKSTLDLREIDLTTLDPRKHDLSQLDPRRIDPAAVTATTLLWAAKATDQYTALVTRGEGVVAKMRAAEEAELEAEAEASVAQPPAAKADAPKPARARKSAAPKADGSSEPTA
jgi:hypothetical protein